MLKSGKTYFKLLDILHNYAVNIIQERKNSRNRFMTKGKRTIEEKEIGNNFFSLLKLRVSQSNLIFSHNI